MKRIMVILISVFSLGYNEKILTLKNTVSVTIPRLRISSASIGTLQLKQKISEFAFHLQKIDTDARLVTIGSRSYYVYRYEGKLNSIENAVVLVSYSKDTFHISSPN